MPINLSTLDNQFRFRPAMGGGGLRTKIFPEAASSDFRYGEPVFISSASGVDYVKQVGVIPSENAKSVLDLLDTDLIVGFALANSTGVTGTPIPVLLCQGAEVLTRLYDANANIARLQDVAVGDLCEIWRYRKLGTDIFMVVSPTPDGAPAVNKAVVVERYSPNNSAVHPTLAGEQALADTYGLVWVAIRSTLSTIQH